MNPALGSNPQVGTCYICGSAIWRFTEHISDERGMFHPICKIMQEATNARREAEEAYSKGVTAGKLEALKYTPEEREAYGKHIAQGEMFRELNRELKQCKAKLNGLSDTTH